MTNILVLNGPNLNLLGRREPAVYGRETLAEIETRCHRRAAVLGLTVEFRQSNHEGALIDWIQEAAQTFSGLVINAAGYGHRSVALHDALKAADLPVVEVHLSNVFARESFRGRSLVSPVVDGVICGLGGTGYELALEALAMRLQGREG